MVNDALIEAGNLLSREEGERAQARDFDFESIVALRQQVSKIETDYSKPASDENNKKKVGIYHTVGTYEANDTASQLFPAIAQGYMLEEVSRKAREVAEEIKGLMEKRLNEL